MARRLRLQYPGAIYHVMNRGDRREAIFRDDPDRERFLETLAMACAKTSWQVHAYCLMDNHFHLVVETPEPNLVAGMKWLLGTYTIRFNRRHALSGHLFAGRYRSQLVGGEGGYLRTACDYVHLNPVRAGMLASDEPIRAYRWSSIPSYLLAPPRRPAWLRIDRLFGECGIPKDSEAGRKEFEERMERLRFAERGDDSRKMRDAWCIGNDQFRQELLSQVNARVGGHHFGSEIAEAEEAKANRIVAEELEKLGWAESSLPARRKGPPEKILIAQRLRQETTMTLEWVARRLCMGAKGHLAHLLYWHERFPVSPRVEVAARKPNRDGIKPRVRRETEPTATRSDMTISRTDPNVVTFDTSFD